MDISRLFILEIISTVKYFVDKAFFLMDSLRGSLSGISRTMVAKSRSIHGCERACFHEDVSVRNQIGACNWIIPILR